MGLTRRERFRRHEINRILYRLKRRYGTPAGLYRLTSVENIETGAVTETVSKIDLPLFVSFEASNTQKFEYDLSFVAANKNFIYGGLFEIGDRIGIIDYVADIDKDYYVRLGTDRYNIERYIELDCQAGYMLHLRHTLDQPSKAIHEKTVIHFLEVTQEVEHE